MKGFSRGKWAATLAREEYIKLFYEVVQMFLDGVVTHQSGKSFALEDVQEAIQESTKEGRAGKVFLKG